MPEFVKKCLDCGGINLILNKEKGEVICKDCGLVIEERMIDFSQEWREFDHDQADSRRRTGAPMTYSVAPDEPILIKENDEIKKIKIGEFVDSLIQKKGSQKIKEANLEVTNVKDENLECISFNENKEINFQKISEVSRHPVLEFYEITLDEERKVKVTGSHSIFTIVNNNEFVPKKVEELILGDLIVCPEDNSFDKNSFVIKEEEIENNNSIALTKSIQIKNQNFSLLKVKQINKIPASGYAYDLTVPGYENFVGGHGFIYLHNTKFDRGLGTDVGQKGDIFKLSGKGRNKYFRLRKWQYRISTAIERNLKLALAELKRVASYLKLPKSVEEESARIYTLAVQRGLVRGRSMESVVAGALYAACRRHEVPRTLDELGEASGIDKKEIGRTYRFVTRELGIRILPSNPVEYIPRFASALKLSAETQSKSVEILEMADNSELTSGRGPTGIAAASLYVAALINNEKRTQREVADIAGVTEVTIRNRYKELLTKLKLKDKIKKVKK